MHLGQNLGVILPACCSRLPPTRYCTPHPSWEEVHWWLNSITMVTHTGDPMPPAARYLSAAGPRDLAEKKLCRKYATPNTVLQRAAALALSLFLSCFLSRNRCFWMAGLKIKFQAQQAKGLQTARDCVVDTKRTLLRICTPHRILKWNKPLLFLSKLCYTFKCL